MDLNDFTHGNAGGFSNYREREKLLYIFTTALDRGDFDTALSIQAQAAGEPVLKKQLDEITGVFYAEALESAAEGEARLVRSLAEQHMTGFDINAEANNLPDLTVADVLARIRVDTVMGTSGGPLRDELTRIQSALTLPTTSLPENLSQARVKMLFLQLGLPASDRFLKLFREKAIFLTMSREQGVAQLAAARRQRRSRQATSEKD